MDTQERIFLQARKEGRTVLTEIETKQVFNSVGIKTVETRLAHSKEEAIAFSKQMGYPVVVKIASPDISHKSDAGGVKIGLKNETDVACAYDEIMSSIHRAYPDARIDGVSVQPLARPGTEIIVGMSKDPQFGPVLMFGLGGILVEVLKDVCFRVVPLTARDASEMIKKIKGYPLLQGFRGQEPANIPFLEDLLLKISDFVDRTPQIKEMDLNPIFAYNDGGVVVDARIVLEPNKVIEVGKPADRPSLDFLFHPKSVAIIGASENKASYGYAFIHHLLSYGFSGKIYPINSRQSEILGVKAYPSLEAVPGNIDYVIHLIGVNNAPEILAQASRKGVKAINILAGRASETGRPEGKQIEAEIRKLALETGIRVLGPNCLGVFCPASGLAFGFEFPKETGKVGALLQSGGNSTDLIHISATRGIRFSKVVSYGNALDINECDLLRYFIDDPETGIILSYMEGLRGHSREYLHLVRQAARIKPVVICKGGRTSVGSRIALSHTASLAGSTNLWETAIRQAGAVPVRDLDEMVNMAVAFSFLPPIKGKNVGIVGAGGGRSVLSADEWEENGFTVPPLPQDIRDELKKRGSQLWDWLDNPADVSIMFGDPLTMPDVLSVFAEHPAFDFIAADAEEDPPFSQETFVSHLMEDLEGYIKIHRQCNKPFLVIFDERSPGVTEMDSYIYRTRADMRTMLLKENLPFFPSVDEAARAVSELISYYRRREENVNL